MVEARTRRRAGDRSRKLLRGEFVIASWGDLTLTSHRLWQGQPDSRRLELTTFALEDIDWARVGHAHATWLLWLGAACAAATGYLVERSVVITYGLVAAAGLCMLLYATTRRVALRVGARGRELTAVGDGGEQSGQAALDFVHALESRKHARAQASAPRPAAGPSSSPGRC